MKTKILICISIIVAFLVGLEFGVSHPKSSFFEKNNQNLDQGLASDVSIYVLALNAFRRGDEKGCANILENSLETDLFALNNDYKTLAKQHDNSFFETIKETRVYRTKYSWAAITRR